MFFWSYNEYVENFDFIINIYDIRVFVKKIKLWVFLISIFFFIIKCILNYMRWYISVCVFLFNVMSNGNMEFGLYKNGVFDVEDFVRWC